VQKSEFWALIDATRKEGTYAHAEALAHELATQPVDSIHLFSLRWDEALNDAYRNDLWNALSVIGGPCGDDHFRDFRAWLVLQGRSVYEAALADPDSLASVVPDDEPHRCQYEVYPDLDAWTAATGGSDYAKKRDSERETLTRLGIEQPPKLGLPTGDDWDVEDEAETRRRLPRLTERFYGRQ
jgi:Protein of unknown function (DUF4240)